jgi:5-methylcytosine-specific restriction protein A
VHERAHKDRLNLRYRRTDTHVERTESHWRMIRARFLATHDVCEFDGDCEMPATEVHHKVDRADGGTSAFDNLEAFCKSHHSKVTAERQVRLVPRNPR